MHFLISESDFHSTTSITVAAGSSKGCTNFMHLVVDDNFGLEGNESFIIMVSASKALVTIVDDDGM